ncbi:glycosyltransferase family 2 protein [Methanobrevibacter sp.]|uniref:glycosyltransferase family 2 protein n=1 Tax=Methanobrevibacter sp. TaxID=66852 RepID=UPI0038906538
MSDYKISMIVPTYNVEDDLKRAIESLLNQTIGFDNIEVLLVDDFSTDNTRQVIIDYAEKYENIKHIFLESNSGSAGRPRNIGIENASADYIMFLDNDDEYVPEACKILYDKISETNVNMIICSKTNSLYSPDDEPEKINEPPEFTEVNVLNNPDMLFSPNTKYGGAMWCKIYKTRFLLDNDIRCLENLPEDVYFMHQCYYLNPDILFLTNLSLYNHYFYRVAGQSISVTLSASFLHKVFLAFDKLRELSLQFGNSKLFFDRYCSLFFDELAYDIVISDLSKDDRISIIKDYSRCAEYSNPNLKSEIFRLWFILARNGHITLTYIYSMVLRFLLKIRGNI